MTLLIVGNLPGNKDTKISLVSILKDMIKRMIGRPYGAGCLDSCLLEEKHFYRTKKRQLLVRQLSRLQTIQAYQAADLFIFPSNIECSPIVLFESCAAGLPFFVTDVGNSEEIIHWTKAGVLLPTKKNSEGYSIADVENSAILIDKYLDKPEDLKVLGASGKQKWLSNYTWATITKNYLELYESLINEKSSYHV